MRKTRPDDIGISFSYPLPGTKFYEAVKAQLGSKTRWQESNDLEMMFEGTYTSDFYRAIRDLLHNQISLQASELQRSGPAEHRARHALERNWRELLAREAQYRSPDRSAAAAR